MVALIWRIGKNSTKNLFTKQKQTTIHRKQTYSLPSGEREGGINKEYGINRYTQSYIK